MREYTFDDLGSDRSPWRKVAKVSAVVLVFLASFAFAFFKLGPWVSSPRPAAEDAVLSRTESGEALPPKNESTKAPESSEPRVWVVPHETQPEPSAQGAGEGTAPEGSEGQAAAEAPGAASQPEPARGGSDQAAAVASAPQEPPLPPRITQTLYRVQLGVFENKDRAQELSDELVQKGYSTYVTRSQRESKVLYKVQVGAFEDEENARALADELKSAGYEVSVTSSSG
jgi:cell division septation protein DedD